MTPPESRAMSWARALACLLATGVGGYYIVWRLTSTLNPGALWFAIPLWAAEVYGFVSSILFFYTAWNTQPRRPWVPAPAGLTVDVMVPTYNEPLWVVRRTLMGALAMSYPHTTYLLDDGRRPEMAELARQLGAAYIARPDNAGAKAGNLNWALERTSGELVAIFDADHVALPQFLERTLGYFTDPTVAFVQTPQEFYNVESFQHATKLSQKRLWHQQQLFYRVLQPGKDHWNAAFFCGSCGVMRRSALDEVGGFATETITEDMHTSFRIHARGWSSAYHNEVLALGLAAQTATPYHLQRLRWGQGTMQLIRAERLLTNPGLSIHQRINYFASALHYFDGYQRILLYVAPSFAVATGVLPIRAVTLPFVLTVAAYYALSMAAFKLTGRGYSMFIATERYHMVGFYTYIRSSLALITRRRLRFKVSPKAEAGRPGLGLVMPAASVAAYTGLCFIAGLVRMALGHDTNTVAFWINTAWSGWIVGLALAAVAMTMRSVDFRRAPRAHAALPVRWNVDGIKGIGVLEDLSERGASLLLPRAVRSGDTVSFAVLWSGVDFAANGTVRRVRRTEAGTHVGLEWDELGGAEALRLSRLAIDLTARRFLLDFNRPPDRVGQLQLSRGHRRVARRTPVAVPVQLGREWDSPWAVTEDLSATGALVLSPIAIAVGTRLELSRWDSRPVNVEVARCQAIDLPPGRAWRLGLRVEGALVAVPTTVLETPAATAVAA
ncbi:MAG TPA: glycosyltransferase [Candidatus Dormibacteraeota bacterium]|nr:glycosyltransferase [Candidatus Dormibacteraeota bacterium]